MKTEYYTKRLRIIPTHRITDMEAQVGWLNDPEVVKYSEQRHSPHTGKAQAIFAGSFKAPNRFLNITRDEMWPLGTMTVYTDEPNKVANVGIMIGDKSQWGKGFGYEAWEAVCDDLLSNGIRKIEAGCMFANKPMLRIFKRYEMFFEGGRRNHFLIDGGTSDMVLYGKFAP